ncbi:hypothetical protein [Microvirga massiliensis]|uniref:hypothetical protein n=1 Tax=Microvirga massiliensis TaxID=1033741 RepID=UPI00062BC587|nr:hypothetical protein [Microvirga massiliensis]
MLGIYEDTFGSSEGLTGAYIILAVVAFMVLRAAPSFFREVRSTGMPLGLLAHAVGCLAFWWFLFQAEFLLAVLSGIGGMIVGMVLSPPANETPSPDKNSDHR